MASLEGVPREEIDWGPTIDESACRDGCRTCLDFCRNGVYGWVDGGVRVMQRTACVRHGWNEPEGFMERATFDAVLDGFGESLLHPRFLDMVRFAKERCLRAEVTTNALLLDEAMVLAPAPGGARRRILDSRTDSLQEVSA